MSRHHLSARASGSLVRKFVALVTLLSPAAFVAQGCSSSGGVGDPCVPEDEYVASFSAFSASEVNIESRSFSCQTRVCLVNHFRGRVSCPFGQDEGKVGGILKPNDKGQIDKANKPAPDSIDYKATCRIPGSTGADADYVNVPVPPQCKTRLPEKAVYCSCRCDGADKDAKYCECPDGFACTPFKELDLGAVVAGGSGQLAGSYCVKKSDEGWKQNDCSTGETVAATAKRNDAVTDVDGKGNP